MKKFVVCLIVLLAALCVFCFYRFVKDIFAANNYTFNEKTNLPSTEALNRFSDGLKLKTVSNSFYHKTDFQEFENFITYIQKAYPEIFKKCEFTRVNKYNIVLKLKGIDSSKKPNVLLGHYDVVDAENSDSWKYPPFSGFFDNEYIYSRGTIDDKASVFAVFEALNDLLINNFQPESDLYLAFSHAEETGSAEGAPSIVSYFKEQNIRFASALDEGGRIVNKKSDYYAFIGTSQKGRLLTKITVFGKGAHASVPSQNSAVSKLAKLITAFAKNNNKIILSDETKAYYKMTYTGYSRLTQFLISNMDIFKPLFIWKISKTPDDLARISSTHSVTVVEASTVPNAVSSEAFLLIDSRIIPEETVEDVKNFINKKISEVLPKEQIKIEYLDIVNPTSSARIDSDEFKKLAKTINQVFPDIKISPYMVLGVTDASEYKEITDYAFCFLPCVLTVEEAAQMHNDNEKISVKNFGRMISFYKEYIQSK